MWTEFLLDGVCLLTRMNVLQDVSFNNEKKDAEDF